jgi:hypothetical protein
MGRGTRIYFYNGKMHIKENTTICNNSKFIITKEDSLIIEKENLRLKKFSDSCEKYKLTCFIDSKRSNAEFYRGPAKFREQFYKNLMIPKKSKPWRK